jgi:exopolysaccharide biosynthesis polyprenyl glycosylphosphotransferase
VLGDLEKFDLVLTHHRADGVIFAVPRKMIPEVEPAVNLCAAMGIQYWIAADLFSHPSGRVGIDMVSGWPLITHEPTHQRRWDLARKRLFDLAFALFTLVASAPLLLLFAAAILVTSGRPVLFVQERCGISGRRFRMLKFRTMVREAEAVRLALATRNEMRGPVFKIADDPRVTRIGRIMRKYCLDELPQLVNVLLGHMSVVGPRPPLPSEVEQYDAWQRRRLSMRPGLTGTWQISGPNRNKISFDEWATMDLNYIDQWSFARDMKLILATIPAIVTGTGR